LSDDDFSFEFTDYRAGRRPAPYLGFNDTSSQSVKAEEIVLFSGGLDSLSGVIQEALGERKRLVLVTHQSSSNLASRQNALVESLKTTLGKNRLFYLPLWVRKGQQEPVEHTQRTRSFLFIAMAMMAAEMFERSTVKYSRME
jgi:hypothetical protein